MRKLLLAGVAAVIAMPILATAATAQGLSVQVGRPDRVERERVVVREREEPVRRRTVVVEEDEEECRIVKKKVRVNGKMVTRTTRIGCD